MDNALEALGAWLLSDAIWLGLGAWMGRRLRTRWHEMNLLAKLTALLLAAPVALAILATLLGLPMILDAIRGDRRMLVSMVGLDGAAMGIAYWFFFCLFNPIFKTEASKSPETRRRRRRGKQTLSPPPSQQ
ncbi:MAG TPA: hypothetical protein VF881_13160 [Polyangiaceae bacterium]